MILLRHLTELPPPTNSKHGEPPYAFSKSGVKCWEMDLNKPFFQEYAEKFKENYVDTGKRGKPRSTYVLKYGGRTPPISNISVQSLMHLTTLCIEA